MKEGRKDQEGMQRMSLCLECEGTQERSKLKRGIDMPTDSLTKGACLMSAEQLSYPLLPVAASSFVSQVLLAAGGNIQAHGKSL